MSTTDALDQLDPKVAEEYRIAEKRFQTLACDVHLPQLDTQLFTKYFLKQKSPQRLQSLKEIVEKLEWHKLATLRILKAAQEREAILQTILDTADAFANRRVTTLEAQTTVLQQLYRHQQITLTIVEGIFAWRNGLTRPYPFQYKGRNYLRKIVEDCEFLDSCQLKAILPLRVAQFPLCSNISALKMFSEKNNGAKVANGDASAGSTKSAGRGGNVKKTSSLGRSRAKSPRTASTPASQIPPNDADQVSRLRAAESVLFAEQNLQVRVMRELLALANKRQFVTLLSTPDIVPNCATGILVSDPQWEGPLREWMQTALQRAERSGADVGASPSPVRSTTRDEPRTANAHSSAEVRPMKVATPPQSPRSSSDGRRSPSVASSSSAGTPRLDSARSREEEGAHHAHDEPDKPDASVGKTPPLEAIPARPSPPPAAQTPDEIRSPLPAAGGTAYDDEFEDDD